LDCPSHSSSGGGRELDDAGAVGTVTEALSDVGNCELLPAGAVDANSRE
jgi:hypothetical protein